MDDSTFLERFEKALIPLDDWHHRQHVKAAYLYLQAYSLEMAIDRMRASIKAFNVAHQVPDEPNRGYHETMTQAWMRLIHFTLCEYGPAETADAFFDQHSELSQFKVLRLFYSQERFLTPLAKTEFVEPDITPLPVVRRLGRRT